MLACLDVLLPSGRLICGVGVGSLKRNSRSWGPSYRDRGAVADEYIQIFKAGRFLDREGQSPP